MIVNLATNAWQAMDGGPGRIDIRLDAWAVDQAMVDSHGELRPGPLRLPLGGRHRFRHGRRLRLPGLTVEPFFSTKGIGKGTGLGLSMVHGLARGHGGTVLVESELRKGSTFRMLLPACVDVATEPELPAVPHELRGDGEWILYLDDEEPLVKLAIRFLERLGYRVSGYTRVEEALAAFRAQPDAFDLVVTDYNMPAMSGMDVALTVMSLRPSVIVALASGYLRPAEAEHATGSGSAPPFASRSPSKSSARWCSACCTPGTARPDAPRRAGDALSQGRLRDLHAHRAGRVRLSLAARLVIPLAGLNLVTGPNGSGKSNLYRALRLLADTAQGRVIPSLAREGGLPSTLWAGPEESRVGRGGSTPGQGTRRKGPISLRLGFAGDDFGYAIDLGLPAPSRPRSLSIPRSSVSACGTARRCGRRPSSWTPRPVRARPRRPRVGLADAGLASFDSMMTQCADPRNTPEMLVLRERIRGWRFYDHFRADASSPARLPQIGTHTPVLGNDGRDVAAASRQSADRRPRGPGRRRRRRLPGLARVGARDRGRLVRGRDDAARPVAAARRRSCRTARCATCSGWPRS